MQSGTEPRTYRVLDVLGRGAFGTVYRADLQGAAGFTKEVALKVLNPDVERHPANLGRLRDEARMLGLIRHRAIVGVDDLVKLNGRWTVVMEYVRGVTLRELLDVYGPMPAGVALAVAEEIASALWAAYTALDRDGKALRLLHRDVKPSNVQLTRRGEVKLLDFGIARGELPREAETRSMVVGSVPYMAPERMELQDSHAADVYSLGFTIVQLLCGRLPATPSGTAEQHRERIAEATTMLAAARAPAALEPVLLRAIAWYAASRPDARELERDCRAIRAALPSEHLSDWAERHVDGILGGRRSVAGEFTGMMLESTPTDRQNLADLLGAAVPVTFDDPRTDETPRAEPTASLEPREPAPPARAVPPPEPARAPPPPIAPSSPPATPARGRGLWRLLAATVIFGGGLALGAVLVTVLAMGGTALLGAGLVAAVVGTEAGCVSNVDTIRADLARERPRGRQKVAPLLDRAERACRAGTLTFLEVADVSVEVDHAMADDVISDEDLADIERVLRGHGG